MMRNLAGLAAVAWAALATVPAMAGDLPDLPVAISNNAVVAAGVGDERVLYSFAGIGGDLGVDAIHARVFRFRAGDEQWQPLADLPGGIGRLAASAVTVGNAIYTFGGYQVFTDGRERSLPDVHRIDPTSGTATARAPMPVPVDDAVALVYNERFVYLVSGWHDVGNVNLVQRYDTETDRWDQATPWPGPPVFGHVGASHNGRLVVCDGVKVNNTTLPRRFVMSAACYLGDIDPDDARRIHWRALPAHPGPACYRATAIYDASEARLLFAGGADNPYNYTGVGYNHIPAEPCRHRYAFDLINLRWVRESIDAGATMDNRALIYWHDGIYSVGGLAAAGTPTRSVRRLPPW